MKPSTVRWGLMFIAAGVIFFMINAGYLDWDYWPTLFWNWWPILLIAIGIEKIFEKTKLKFLAYLSPLLIIVVMAGVAVEFGDTRFTRGNYLSSYEWEEEISDTIDKITATIEHGRYDLRILKSSNELAEVKVRRATSKPEIDYHVSNGVAFLDLEPRGREPRIRINGRHVYNDWRVAFADEIPLELECLGDGSDLRINLESVPLQKLKIKNEDGEIYIKIGGESQTVTLDISGEDSQLKLRVPDESGIFISGQEYKNYLKQLEFVEADDGFKSAGYETADIKINVMLDDSLGSLSIVYY